MDKIVILIAKDFTDAPGGRYIVEGSYSGEEFRKDLLEPAYKKAVEEKKKLFVDLDGCYGFPSSFLDESFGGLARIYGSQNVLNVIEFKSLDQPSLIDDIKEIIRG